MTSGNGKAAAATAYADARTAREQAATEFALSDAAVILLQREIDGLPLTSQGVLVPAGLEHRYERATGRRERAEAALQQAMQAETRAAGALYRIEKSVENRANHEAHLAREAAARVAEEKQLTLHQRALRDARKLLADEASR